jgi:hypothetical protein
VVTIVNIHCVRSIIILGNSEDEDKIRLSSTVSAFLTHLRWQYCQECTEVDVFLEWQSQGQVCRDVIKVSPAVTLSSQITGDHQFANDSLGLTLGYVQGRCDIAQARARIARDQEQRIAVIGQQPKAGFWV